MDTQFPPDFRVIEEANQIRTLSICHYVLSGLTALAASFPLIHVVIGFFIVSGKFPGASPGTPPIPADAAMVGWMFLIMGLVFVLGGWGFAICLFLAGRWLAARRYHTFCFVVAAVECVWMPLGTILGVFTILFLQRPSVRVLFMHPPLPPL